MQFKLFHRYFIIIIMRIKIAIWIFFLISLIESYVNPIQGQRDSPDPGVIYVDGYYYAVTTGGWDGHYYPIWQSSTGVNFTQVGWGMLNIPSWARCCDFWAPQIHYINDYFFLYYTTRDSTGKLCIGASYSKNILGPYTDKGSPIVSNSSQGVIDATVLNIGAINYLVYKVDGNAHGQPTLLYAYLLDPTGLTVRGDPILLLRNDQNWEKGIVEGQWFIYQNGYYYLFYSGCGYNNDCYSVGVARSTNPLGPYQKYSQNPILYTKKIMTSKSWEGPGHCSVVKSLSNQWLMIYHAWPRNGINTKRVMLADKIRFQNGWPVVNDGSPSENQMPNP